MIKETFSKVKVTLTRASCCKVSQVVLEQKTFCSPSLPKTAEYLMSLLLIILTQKLMKPTAPNILQQLYLASHLSTYQI